MSWVQTGQYNTFTAMKGMKAISTENSLSSHTKELGKTGCLWQKDVAGKEYGVDGGLCESSLLEHGVRSHSHIWN